MPLYTSFTVAKNTQVLVWKITESYNELFRAVQLKDFCMARLEGMRSESHQRGFLSVRMLLQTAGYTDFDLYYNDDGKPHLKDGKEISITHSYGFSAIIISDKNVGIDIELRRDKVIRIADKFIDTEFEFLDQADDFVRKLIVIWGAKEAIYKMLSRNGLSFKQNMNVLPFSMEEKKGRTEVKFEEINSIYQVFFEEIEEFTMVYTIDD